MSVNIAIRQKGLFKKNITIKEIIESHKLNYGVVDKNYTLNKNKLGSEGE